MGDILSQNEIDDLLRALSSGESSDLAASTIKPKKEAKLHDFAKPPKFNKEQLRTLEIVFDNFARLVSSFMTGYLRVTTHLEVENAEQTTYKEFTTSMINPVLLGIVDFSPLKGSIMMEVSSSIGYTMIDRLLGGPGIGIKKIRDFSDIEKIILEKLLSQMINYLIEPWENVVELQPRLEKLETNSQFAQIISPNEIIALVTLRINIGKAEGMMHFCIPHLVVESIMERLNTKFWFTQVKENNTVSYKEDLEEQLEKASIPIGAVVGKTYITVDEFVNLQVGDIIPLDSYITSDISVYVGNLHKFYAKPGIHRGKNSIQITSLIAREE